MGFLDISKQIGEILQGKIPKIWDARESILEMKNAGYRQWRQMEWQGFYFQFLCERRLKGTMEIPGPKYGNVEFDGFREIPWDFKTHAMNTSNHQVIVNDSEAIANAIKEYEQVGLILALGKVLYNDEDRSFQKWHQELKGGKAQYVKDRIKRGAWSRLRKVSFNLQQIAFVKIADETLIECGSFQENFRNANGSARRSKVLIDLEKINKEGQHFIEF